MDKDETKRPSQMSYWTDSLPPPDDEMEDHQMEDHCARSNGPLYDPNPHLYTTPTVPTLFSSHQNSMSLDDEEIIHGSPPFVPGFFDYPDHIPPLPSIIRDDDLVDLSQQRSLPQVIDSQSAEHSAHDKAFESLGRRLQVLGEYLQIGHTMLPSQLLDLQKELQELIGQVDNLIQARPGAGFPLTYSRSNQSQPEYRCLLCEKDGVTITCHRDRGVFKRHLMSQHFPSHEYHCPAVGCGKIHRLPDEFEGHYRVEHQREPQEEVLGKATTPLTCPPRCDICYTMVHSWGEFYHCLMKHCLVSLHGSESGIDTSGFDERPQLNKRKLKRPRLERPRSGSPRPGTSRSETSHIERLQTNITRPDQEDEFELDTGISYTDDMENLLNPGAYYRKLDMIERRTAEICGVDRPELERESPSRDNLRKSRDALRYLTKERFCLGVFSILVEDQSRPGIAKAVQINSDDINDAINRCYLSAKGLADISNSTSIENWPLLRNLLGRPSPGTTLDQLEHLQFLTNALSIGLVSFAGSHVCRFDENLWGEKKNEISIGHGYSFALRELACLKNLVGGPAWVLGRKQGMAQKDGLKVSLTVRDLRDLWGPVWLMGGREDKGPFLRTEAGYIIPLPRSEQNNDSLNEIECHWTSSFTGHESENPIMLNRVSRILIGTEPSTTTGLFINKECRSQIDKLQSQILPQLQPSGAREAYHTLEGWNLTVRATMGSSIQAEGKLNYKRIPARNWKKTIIDICKHGKPNLPSLLSCNIGLEVSACTGNAHRVTLWDALRLSQTVARRYPGVLSQDQASPPCLHGILDPNCIKTCWTRLLSTDDIDLSVITSPEDSPARKEHTWRMIQKSIIALKDTGVDRDNNLQAYWPFTENPRTHRIEPSPASGEINNWIKVIKDSRDVATFAVISQRCMEVHHEHVRTCATSLQVADRNRPKTALYTRILLSPQIQSTCTENHDCHMGDSVMGNEMDKLIPHGCFVLGEAALTVKRIVPGDEKLIIATVGGSAVKNGWIKFVKPDRRMFQEVLDYDVSTGYHLPLLVQ